MTNRRSRLPLIFWVMLGILFLVILFFMFAVSYFATLERENTPGNGSNLSGSSWDTLASLSGCGNVPPAKLKTIFDKAGNRFGVQPAFLAAIFHSGEHGAQGDPNAPWPYEKEDYGEFNPPKAAQGPFQFMDNTWPGYEFDGNNDGKKEVHNIWDSAFAAARYLSTSLGAGGMTTDRLRLVKAARGYNAGPGHWDRNYAETNAYEAHVMPEFEKLYQCSVLAYAGGSTGGSISSTGAMAVVEALKGHIGQSLPPRSCARTVSIGLAEAGYTNYCSTGAQALCDQIQSSGGQRISNPQPGDIYCQTHTYSEAKTEVSHVGAISTLNGQISHIDFPGKSNGYLIREASGPPTVSSYMQSHSGHTYYLRLPSNPISPPQSGRKPTCKIL